MRFVILLLAVPLLAQQRGVNFYSTEKERALGDSLAADTRRTSKPFENAVAEEYVKRVGAQMVGQLADPRFEYTFEVIAGAATEPMALPGGHIFVPAQFFVSVQNEAEFATMLAHAVAHVSLRHGTRTATRSQISNESGVPLIMMGGSSGTHASTRAADVLIPMGMLSFQRQMELEADKLGVELADRVGYNPTAYRTYLQRVQVDPENTVRSPLPPLAERLARLDEVLGDRSRELPPSSVAFTQAQQAIQETLKKPESKPPTLRRQ